MAFGDLEPGLQTGYCKDTGGGWATAMVAHPSQLHPVPDEVTDEAAVMVEPAACAVHAAFRAHEEEGVHVVLGAGTLGLLTVAALRAHATPETIICAAKRPHQRALATELGADLVVEPSELTRTVRRAGPS